MPDDVAITIPAELDEALTALATARGKSKTALVRDALAEFVLSEQAFVAAVEISSITTMSCARSEAYLRRSGEPGPLDACRSA